MRNETGVTVVRLDIPFGNLVWFLVKLSIAAIPAGIILAVMWAIVGAVFAGLFGGMGGMGRGF